MTGKNISAEICPKFANKKICLFLPKPVNGRTFIFQKKVPDFTPVIAACNSSPFRKRVWDILASIPYGQTTTYGKIAEQIENETGKRISAQAVGGAVGRNPVSIVVPCHRVVGANGNLTGYAGGIAKKIELLKLEGIDVAKFK